MILSISSSLLKYSSFYVRLERIEISQILKSSKIMLKYYTNFMSDWWKSKQKKLEQSTRISKYSRIYL